MKIYKLIDKHSEMIRPLFYVDKFMGVDTKKNNFVDNNINFSDFYHKTFEETYLSDLKQYHAFGIENDKKITAVLGFYQSLDDASWYWNVIRTLGNNKLEIQLLLDHVLKFNESMGYFKFYSMFPKQYSKVYRKLAFSPAAAERYDYFDEYYVPIRHQCKFTLAWQILYTRTLLPVETIVRCTFLKQKYRKDDYCAGRL